MPRIWLPTLALLLTATGAHAWNLHNLITDRALSHPAMWEAFSEDYPARLKAPLRVETLERFVSATATGLPPVFEAHYDWLQAHESKRFKRVAFDPSHPARSSTEAFLRAARLNPQARFYEVEALKPGQPAPKGAKTVEYKVLSPYSPPENNLQFVQVQAEQTTPHQILSTYADEPDWQIDGGLWTHEEYGYGEPPYGNKEGVSSVAPFHTLFAHEPWIVRVAVPTIDEGMAQERVELFRRLARYAFASKHPYWGYRFAAWALHYVQDLSQPYHSDAMPHGNVGYYLSYIFSFNKDRFVRETTQLMINRHRLFEDFQKELLQTSYAQDAQPLAQLTAESITRGRTIWELDITHPDSTALVERVGGLACSHSKDVDSAVIQAYGPSLAEDPDYDYDKPSNYDPLAVFKTAQAPALAQLARATGQSLEVAGQATRTLLRMCVEL